jgi:glutaminyl-peptide cyclotransferase
VLLLAWSVVAYQIISTSLLNRKPEQLIPEVLAVWPHDPSSFTEGLLWYDGFLYESSGFYGKSNLRKVNPQTGMVLQHIDDPTTVFGEGIALDGNRLFQLTWHENIGYVYDLDTLTQVETISYEGEGWGLCFDGQYFFMSNGSAFIFKRDSKTFAILGSIQVMQNSEPITKLNELECVGNSIYANVWMTNNILRINKVTGRVIGVIDASGLLTPEERAQTGSDGVLNGIAYDPGHAVFLITGKLWPKLFEVKFVRKIGN